MSYAERLARQIYAQRPKNSTGIYLHKKDGGFSYSYRTNKEKFPENFIPFGEFVNLKEDTNEEGSQQSDSPAVGVAEVGAGEGEAGVAGSDGGASGEGGEVEEQGAGSPENTLALQLYFWDLAVSELRSRTRSVFPTVSAGFEMAASHLERCRDEMKQRVHTPRLLPNQIEMLRSFALSRITPRELVRAHHEVVCHICGRIYADHPEGDIPSFRLICDGSYVKL